MFHQPTVLDSYNVYDADQPLRHWVKTFQGNYLSPSLSEFGQRVSSGPVEAGFAANKYKSKFKSYSI
ncbi:hypothetical protein NBRC116188_29280 [Oceaniserpentilla sp. 4NH20-0058]|uniref:hypothetical protein n=1 Tax=Oceaniserpentilla sp. 4NH20-0058 TaxID=3127660 RepID=UPI00310357D3